MRNLSRPLENAGQPNKLASPKIVSPCLELLFCKILRKLQMFAHFSKTAQTFALKFEKTFQKQRKCLCTFLRGNQIGRIFWGEIERATGRGPSPPSFLNRHLFLSALRKQRTASSAPCVIIALLLDCNAATTDCCLGAASLSAALMASEPSPGTMSNSKIAGSQLRFEERQSHRAKITTRWRAHLQQSAASR